MSFGPSASGAGGLHRASFRCRDTDDTLDVHYNPMQVRLNKAAVHLPAPQQSAAKGSKPEFIQTHTRSLGFTLTLEEWSTGKSVADAVTQLQQWMNPLPESLKPGQTPVAPTIEFLWWNDPDPFVGVITQANATYTVFDTDGHPVRASVDISMNELPLTPDRQNPTSGSPGGGETTLVREHDTLAGIAYRQYGDAALWRGLATANNVTDPMSLKPGQRLLLPALSAVKGMS
jgi:hypothetical protein